jgi:hypothetical protein
VVIVVWAVIVARSVNCASEKVCVTPFEVTTVVGSVYTTEDVVVLPGGKYGSDSAGSVIVLVTPPALIIIGSGSKLLVNVKVKDVAPDVIGML